MLKTCLSERAFTALNLKQYNKLNGIEKIAPFEIESELPERLYILRMMVKRLHDEFQIPDELLPFKEMITFAHKYQKFFVGIEQPFCYVTIRHGVVTSENDDEWHADGFSTKITHLPEQNYIWSNIHPTEYVEKKFKFPADFNPLIHNVHKFFQNRIKKSDIKTAEAKTMYGMGPYIVHRRPYIPQGTIRTFVRISFTPIEIVDSNNTQNPLLPTLPVERDGVKIRESLLDYDIENAKLY